jgi:glucose/arabinose dehydrogenase
MKVKCHARIAALLLLGLLAVGHAQGQEPIGVPVPPLGAGPWVFDTAEQHEIRVSVVTRGLSHPWAIAFLPEGAMLITERPGRLRVVRDGVQRLYAIGQLAETRLTGP